LHWPGREKKKRRRKRRSTGDITTDTATTRMTNEDIRGGVERMTMATGVPELSIDDVGQTHIRDLHHQSGEETDLGHQSQEETGRGRRS
jgi:hypothetical protein